MNTTVKRQSSRGLVLRLVGHLSRKRRWQLIALVNLMLISGIAELISLGTVLPFLAVLIDPSSIWDNHIVQILIAWGKYTKPEELITPITIGFCSICCDYCSDKTNKPLAKWENGCSDRVRF